MMYIKFHTNGLKRGRDGSLSFRVNKESASYHSKISSESFVFSEMLRASVRMGSCEDDRGDGGGDVGSRDNKVLMVQ